MDSEHETMSPGFVKICFLRILIALILGYVLLVFGMSHLHYTWMTQPPIEVMEDVPYGLADSPQFSPDPYTQDTAPKSYTFMNLTGTDFEIDDDFWNKYRFLVGDQGEISGDVMEGFVVAVAASSNHFPQSIDAVQSVQRLFPGKKILYFDWGLESNESDAVSAWCDVELKSFNFSDIRSLHGEIIGESWHYQVAKPFAMAEALRDNAAVLWIDSTARLLSSNIDYVFEVAEGDGGIVFLDKTVQGATKIPPPIYDYLPTNLERSNRKKHVSTGTMFFMKTRLIRERILWWWLLCSNTRTCFFHESLEAHCEVIKDARKNRNMDTGRDCSRVDQSILNILAGNLFHYEWDKYCLESGLGTLFKLSQSNRHTASICP
ncbi:hypothetical protein CAPTEDRAFT_225261 [Capitella teleta]|uniref:Nucleotide-diphospho-sugar transferase domain-containing protein n=1 Tax=Capitella teleta TaxID=283909 RepID=R7TXI0_CAPTE|nr:hypothetical protein CAPTEDRAFT_225261 [Capitella teleta]|eukprot:ELT98434.1 hypothetical protein CAPTEDRAFT_225261 [Capitella teleta]